MNQYSQEFGVSMTDIDKLVDLPKSIQEMTLQLLSDINHANLKPQEQLQLSNCMKGISNISRQSLGSSFKIIYNQVCILAVSALSAYTEKYFQESIKNNLSRLNPEAIKKIKITLQEAANLGFNLTDNIGQIIIDKNGNSINFQDLQSTTRSFEEYLNKNIVLTDSLINEIIFYQQCRHILVHNNGTVNNDFIRKTGSANKKNYSINDQIQLDQEDWDTIQESFLSFYTLITT